MYVKSPAAAIVLLWDVGGEMRIFLSNLLVGRGSAEVGLDVVRVDVHGALGVCLCAAEVPPPAKKKKG